jgi:lactoylglutathione lyase
VSEPKYQMMHAMVRVMDPKKSTTFYTNLLGMRLLCDEDFPDGKVTLAFVGY